MIPSYLPSSNHPVSGSFKTVVLLKMFRDRSFDFGSLVGAAENLPDAAVDESDSYSEDEAYSDVPAHSNVSLKVLFISIQSATD
jgi:hypothetical protein